MQKKDTETVGGLRRHHNRVSTIKSMIIHTLLGWTVLSIVLTVCLFVLLFQTRKQVEELSASYTVSSTEELDEETLFYTEKEDYKPAVPAASGISERENLAGETDIHKVYLTFEDGPSENTAEILDILKEKNVQATFFVTAKEGEEAQALYQRIVEEGHTLGMHSYSNKYTRLYQSEENFKEDIIKLQGFLLGVTGVEPIYYRFPGGSSNQITNVPMENLIHYLNQEGLVYYDWNVSVGDSEMDGYTSAEIVANVIDDVVKYKEAVVLMSDAQENSVNPEVLRGVIDALSDMGAEILPIDKDSSVIQFVKADTVE